jgi:hypothetical protein
VQSFTTEFHGAARKCDYSAAAGHGARIGNRVYETPQQSRYGTLFTPQGRDRLRSEMLEYARYDDGIDGAALTGSGAAECEDEWSDIDLAFGIAERADVRSVLADWTAYMYDRHQALHHFDVTAGAWIYRVFLLPSTLQVDLAFVPALEFRALAPTFRLIFGKSNEPQHIPPPRPADLIGWAWLYAMHVRSCITRRKLWQTEYMISGARDTVLALACVRHNLPALHGRGFDQLPTEVTALLEGSLVRELNTAELARAFRVVVDALLVEIRHADRRLAERLQGTLKLLVETAHGKDSVELRSQNTSAI